MYRTTIRGSLYGQTVDVVMGWTTGGVTSSANAVTLATRVENYWAADVMQYLVSDYALTQVDAVGMDDPTKFGTFLSTSTGTNGSDGVPAFLVANVQLQTGIRGRSYNGRFGVPGLAASTIDSTNSNFIDSTAVSTIQNAIGNFIGDLSGGGLPSTLSVISTISGGTPRPTPIATPVTVATVHQAWGSRISRKG